MSRRTENVVFIVLTLIAFGAFASLPEPDARRPVAPLRDDCAPPARHPLTPANRDAAGRRYPTALHPSRPARAHPPRRPGFSEGLP